MKLYVLLVESFVETRCFVRNDLEEIEKLKNDLLNKDCVDSSTFFRVFETDFLGYEAVMVSAESGYALTAETFAKGSE